MARQEPPTSWCLPTATPQKSTGLRVAVPLRLHPDENSSPSLWLATHNTTDLILTTWAHEQEYGGIAEVFTWSDGVVIRTVKAPQVPFHPAGVVQAYAKISAYPELFLPRGMSLRPAFRVATWQRLRITKSVHLFDGTRWLVLPLQGFRSFAEMVEVVTPTVHPLGLCWTKLDDPEADVNLLGSPAKTARNPTTRTAPVKAKASFTQQLRQLFTSNDKKENEVPRSVQVQRGWTSRSARASLRNDLVQQLLRRAVLPKDKEINAWQQIAKAYDGVDEHQVAIALTHVAWLRDDVALQNHGLGVRAQWLAALEETKRRGGDSLHLATVYDLLLRQIETGLSRVHDLPAFLWPTANDHAEELIELRELFFEYGPSTGVASAFAGVLFASAALTVHEPRLASIWLAVVREMLTEQRCSPSTQSMLSLCEVVQSGTRFRTSEQADVVVALQCPKIAALTMRCQSLSIRQQRMSVDDPQWAFLGGDAKIPSAKQLLQAAEQEHTATILPRIIFQLGSTGACRTRDEVIRWVAMVPDAIELQAEFWRARLPGETHLFDLQVRWCERLLTWTFDHLRQHQLDATEFLQRIFVQAQERDTPLRTALALREWYVARCTSESDLLSERKAWLALGLPTTPATLLLLGKKREAGKVMDNLQLQLAEAPLETPSTARAASLLMSACFILPRPQAMERGRSLTRIIGQRLTEQGDEDFFALKNLATLDGLLSTLLAKPSSLNEEVLAWIADDEQRLRKRMARDLARVLAAIN